ncbi:hypothetical protein BH24BAC1_BH24BAC1_26520 [soil metagenome]
MATIKDQQKFDEAIARFDAYNAQDPNQELYGRALHPKELLYARRMTDWLLRVAPEASEALQLAARSQHIGRWQLPRKEYPEGVQGYNKWRNTLKKRHAELAGQLLQEVGYDQATIDRVQFLVQKRQLKLDPEVQLLEDVICLVFLENYFADFSRQHSEEKLMDIVQKTWRKMSPEGQQVALTLQIPEPALRIIEKALAG